MTSAIERGTEAAVQRTTALGERITNFVSENKRAVIISAVAATAVAGGAYYYYTSSPSTSKPPGEGRKKAKKSKKSRSRATPKSGTTSGDEEAAAAASQKLDEAEKGQAKSKVEEIEADANGASPTTRFPCVTLLTRVERRSAAVKLS